MAKPIVLNHATDEDLRRGLAITAICEIDGLTNAIDPADFDPDLWRGARLRLTTLGSIVLAVLNDGDDSQNLADMLYGPGGWLIAEEAEVANV